MKSLMKGWRWLALSTCLLSLLLSLLWGPYLDNKLYIIFNEARAWTAVTTPASFWTSPIYFVILWLFAKSGVQVWLVSLVISGLCWGGMAVLAVRLLDVPKVVAVVTAVFITLSPTLLLIAGKPIALTLLAAFLALFLTKQQAWRGQSLVLCLLPLLHFDLSSLILLLALLWLRWRSSGSFPKQTTLLLLAAYGLWGALNWSVRGLAGLLTFPPSFAEIAATTGDLYWLLIPLLGLGVLSLKSQPILRVVVLWTVVSLLSSGEPGLAVTAVTTWLLAGCGLHHLLNLLNTSHEQAQSLALSAITLPLLALSLLSLGQWYNTRPIVRFDLENQASIWVRTNSQPQATLMASAHILSQAQRPGITWQGQTVSQLMPLLSTIQTTPPDYLVTDRTVPFDQLSRAAWFQENYVSLQQFTSPYESTAPLTIWGYRPTVYRLGQGRPLNVQTDHNLNVVGYEYKPTRLQAGEDLHLTLFLQATDPITTPLNAWLRLVTFNDNQEWVRQITPITADPTSDTALPQLITATIPPDTPVGAYQLSFSLQVQGDENVLALYRNNDVNMLDRVGLGNVIVTGGAIASETVPVNAHFGDQITLLSYALEQQPDALIVDLFWQATQPPTNDYVVFIHLLTNGEQLVASQDSPPLDGRFPTSAWLPNDIIPDRHIVPLNPGTTGSYQLNIGLYLPHSGERLPIVNSDGTPIPNNTLTLQVVAIE